jgi:PEP-CTERM motif
VNGKMKNKAIQKFSPFALGTIVLISQMAGSMAYGASLNTAASDNSLLKPNVSELQPSSAVGGGCDPLPTGNGSLTSAVSGKNLKSLDTSDTSSVLASSTTGSVVSSSMVAGTPVTDPGTSNFSSNLVAQAPGLDDCCEIGGTTTCEVGGLAPAGGGALAGGLSPLAALAGLPLAGLIPLALGGDGDNGTTPPPPVPEPSTTAAITAGLGLLGLWYGRRYRASHKASL